MALSAGSRLGPYEILSAIGAGGMGEVYKARDTRLERTVAIKVLSEEFAANPGRRERFEREARAVAALSHPHICALHDVGEAPAAESASSNGAPVRFLVMECLDGPTLAEHLVRGPLPPGDVLRYAAELADALDHAHRRGLIHRDLKPGNVMLTRDGAKLLDFGLSKAQAAPNLLGTSRISPEGAPVTTQGELLGTFPYMSPEQLEGREADARSDIFALGAVIYEMATGRRAFEGTTAATVIGAVLHTDPPLVSTLQPLAPAALDRIVARCLAKHPDNRWQSARDLQLELEWITKGAEPVAAERQRGRRSFTIATVAALGLASIAAALAITWRRGSADDLPIQLSFTLPDELSLTDPVAGGGVAIAPDGTRLAFVAFGSDGRNNLYVRALGSEVAQVLAGTESAAYPFWSPDGRSLGFFAKGKLKKIQLPGSPPQIICDARQAAGGTWSRDGTILFSAAAGRELYRVGASGAPATKLPDDGVNLERHRPFFLPDGRHFVYYGRPQKWGIFVASIDAPGTPRFLRDGVNAVYANGHLVTLLGATRGSVSGTLLAQPFDAGRLEAVGEAFPVAEQVEYRSGVAMGAFSLSQNGTLVYGNAERRATQLRRFDRSGHMLEDDRREAVAFKRPVFSPDGKTVAVELLDSETQQEDLWLIDTTRGGIASRFTSNENLDINPVWSPDGTRIVFASPRGTPPNLYEKAVGGAGTEELLFGSDKNSQPTDWSRDGRFIAFATLDPETQWDLWFLPTFGPRADRKPIPFLRTEFNEHLARFSPDGRWLAYVSDESGTNEVYLKPFQSAGGPLRISARGGSAPRWRGDGAELFYLAPDGTFMAVGVKPGASLETDAPVPLFKRRVFPDPGSVRDFWEDGAYAVSSDGQRFLIVTFVPELDPVRTQIVFNWPALRPRR